MGGAGGVRPGAAGQGGAIQVPVAGVTLLAVLLLIAVSSVMMGQAMETYDSLVRHELEQDLIFRGEEYRRGIEIFQRVNGRPPVKLEELCPKEKGDVRYVRRCWKDPITGKDFRTIGPGEAGRRRALNQQKEQQEKDKAGGLLGGRDHEGEEGEADGSGPSRSRLSGSGPTLSKITFSLPGQESRQQLKGDRPFIGVASDSDLKGFITFNDLTVYSEWEFVAVQTQRPGAVPAPLPGATPRPGFTPPPGFPPGFTPTPASGGRFPTPPAFPVRTPFRR